MKKIKPITLLIACLVFVISASAQIPYLKKNQYGATQLIVHGKPFLMLCGEANNSSGSNIPYMDKMLKTMRESNLNSVLVSVSWEIIEPMEGNFDFTSVDELIRVARANDIKLGILWFGAWKNGLSPYAPIWVISNTKRFTRVKSVTGENTRTLSPLCTATRDADTKAFTALMNHIADIDSKDNTILVMQIENEMGTLGQTRDFSSEANKLFESQVPSDLIQYMVKNKATLETELKTPWESNGSKTKGTWTEVFGKNDDTDLFFMAWNYSKYANSVAEAGKKAYNIPMYVNAWMPNPRPNPGQPGNFPSGGPILSVLDIWKAGAPAVDMLSPDLYGADFKDEAKFFHRADNPLFIPETNGADGPGTYAFAQEDAICFSPFGIDYQGTGMAKEYGILNQMMPLITQYQGSGKMVGFYKTKGDTIGRDIQLNKDVIVSIKFQKPWRFPAPAATTQPSNNPFGRQREPNSYGVFVQTGENEFYVAGFNLAISANSSNPKKQVWLKDAWEGSFDSNGVWKPLMLHNGDEAGFLRSGDPVYRISAYRVNPAEPAIFRFKTVPYDK